MGLYEANHIAELELRANVKVEEVETSRCIPNSNAGTPSLSLPFRIRIRTLLFREFLLVLQESMAARIKDHSKREPSLYARRLEQIKAGIWEAGSQAMEILATQKEQIPNWNEEVTGFTHQFKCDIDYLRYQNLLDYWITYFNEEAKSLARIREEERIQSLNKSFQNFTFGRSLGS